MRLPVPVVLQHVSYRTPKPRGLYITSCKLPLCPTWNRFGLETVLRVDKMGPQQCGTISPCELRAPELVSYQIGQALPFAPDERRTAAGKEISYRRRRIFAGISSKK